MQPQTSINAVLWDQILAFDLDAPPSEYGFSIRLAKENFWSERFTSEAILEYKKFMYLAATSDLMVSPSGIVDTVWHQHLIFTQSYTDFCVLLGKQVQHVPSTHNRNEFQKFRQAKESTTSLYLGAFGPQPSSIWNYDDMFATLELPKARLKLRTVVLIAIFAFTLLMVPVYFAIKPLYLHIDNPYFMIGFSLLIIACFVILELFNQRALQQIENAIPASAFVFNLSPRELVYLKTQKLDRVVIDTINQLIIRNCVNVNADHALQHSKVLSANDVAEHQVLEVLHQLGPTKYKLLLIQLSNKPIFSNVANSMEALKKYFLKSRAFGRIFYINLVAILVLLLFGIERY